MEINCDIILIIILSCVGIFFSIINISLQINDTKNIDSFISGLTPDMKPSILKNQSFTSLRYELLHKLWFIRKSIKINLIILLISVVIFIIGFNYFQSSYINNYKELKLINKYELLVKEKENNLDSLNNKYLKQQNITDSLYRENILVKQQLNQKLEENKRLNSYIYKLMKEM